MIKCNITLWLFNVSNILPEYKMSLWFKINTTYVLFFGTLSPSHLFKDVSSHPSSHPLQFFLKITLRLSVSVPFSIRRFGKREAWNFGAIVVILSVMALFRGSSARPPSRWVISLQNKTGDLPASAGFLNMNLHWRQQTHKIACVSRYCVFVLPKEIKCMKAISLSLATPVLQQQNSRGCIDHF